MQVCHSWFLATISEFWNECGIHEMRPCSVYWVRLVIFNDNWGYFMRIAQLGLILALVSLISACSGNNPLRGTTTVTPEALSSTATEADRESTIWDVFNNDVSTSPVKVNRYIWQASLEVLDFMPIERIDPFSGIIVMGYGTPPGGRTAYRATVHVSEPALDARTLRVALATRNGPAFAETMRALEDAILSRARQIRRDDGRL